MLEEELTGITDGAELNCEGKRAPGESESCGSV